MKKHVLFIHGAGQGAYEEDLLLVASLQNALGSAYDVRYPITLYYSRDDEIEPFAHLALYAAVLPQATIREVDGRGHQFGNDLADIAEDVMREEAASGR